MSGVVAVHVGESQGEERACKRWESLQFALRSDGGGVFLWGEFLSRTLSRDFSLSEGLSLAFYSCAGVSWSRLCLGAPGTCPERRVLRREGGLRCHLCEGLEELEKDLAGQWVGLRVEGVFRARPRKWTLWKSPSGTGGRRARRGWKRTPVGCPLEGGRGRTVRGDDCEHEPT